MFDELHRVDKFTMGSKEIVTQLFHTIKLLESALACAPDNDGEDAEEDCELVYTTALDLVARDSKVLFELFFKKLSWVVREAEIGDLFDSAGRRRMLPPYWRCSRDLCGQLSKNCSVYH